MSAPRSGVRLPVSVPPRINHTVLTGTLSADPEPGRSPLGDPVLLLAMEFPVIDPAHRRTLWTWASCLVEVPDGCKMPKADELRGGAPALVWGQLSTRWMIEDGHTSRRGVIVANLVKAGLPECVVHPQADP